jgi:hypothetical protein
MCTAAQQKSLETIYEKLGCFDIEVTIRDYLTTLFPFFIRPVSLDFYPISTILLLAEKQFLQIQARAEIEIKKWTKASKIIEIQMKFKSFLIRAHKKMKRRFVVCLIRAK